MLVLSTDGLYGEIPENTLCSILSTDTNLETKARALVKAALETGGKDNITVVMAKDRRALSSLRSQPVESLRV
jgi:protein phosphatase